MLNSGRWFPIILLLTGSTLLPIPAVAGEEELEWEEEAPGYLDRVSLHGYGELHYNNPKTGSRVPEEDTPAQMDFHRLVIGVSYSFSDRITLHSEIDFEHAATELELEFAYLDFLVKPKINFRVGSVLMPVGPLNEFHEPTLFYSVERPYVQTYIIPSTWQEGGAGIFGTLREGLQYRAYVVSGLDAAGFSSSSGIRGGRGKVAEELSDDLAGVGRLEMILIPGFDAGLSLYWGGAGQGNTALDDASVGIVEGDIRFRRKGFDLRAVVTRIGIGGAEEIGDEIADVGEVMLGWYVESAYDLLRLRSIPLEQSLVAFVRLESFDTQHRMPAGRSANPANDRMIVTGGLAYYPHPDVALKADFERWEDGTDETGTRFNLATAFQY